MRSGVIHYSRLHYWAHVQTGRVRRRCWDPRDLTGPVPGMQSYWIPPQTVPLKKGDKQNVRVARRALAVRADQDSTYRPLPNPPDATRLSRIPGGLPRRAQPHLRASERTRVGSVASLATGRASRDHGYAPLSVYTTGCGSAPKAWRRKRTAGGYSPKYTVLSHLGHLEAMVGELGRSAPSTRAGLCAAARSRPAHPRASIGSATWAGPREPAPRTPAAGRAAGGAHLPGSEGRGLAPPTPE